MNDIERMKFVCLLISTSSLGSVAYMVYHTYWCGKKIEALESSRDILEEDNAKLKEDLRQATESLNELKVEQKSSSWGSFFSNQDAACPWQFSFSDPATPIMEGIINFHNDLMFFIVVIFIFVSWMIIRCVMIFHAPVTDEVLDWENQKGFLGALTKNSQVRILNSSSLNNNTKNLLNTTQLYLDGTNHHTAIEIAWTVAPALILMLIAVPSFALLYSMEEFVEPSLTVKCTGHQWYWCYEYSNCNNISLAQHIDGMKFESYMVPTEELEIGNLRLLEVTNRLHLPVENHVQVTVTAADVLHCWAVPSLGIKIDACPGRINQASIFIKREGCFYGQCSEICGENHGFMPIVVKGLDSNNFLESQFNQSVVNMIEEEEIPEEIQKFIG